MISRASSPGKIILFGEHFVVYGLKAILCAINKRIIVTSETIPEEKILISSSLGQLSLDRGIEIEDIDSPLKPLYFIADKLLKQKKAKGGIKIKVESEIPSGVGLGSSSACCVAGAASIARLFGKPPKEEILELAIESEKTIYKNTSGADCTICTFGGIMEYDKKHGFKKIESKPNLLLTITNSGITHSTKDVVHNVSEYASKNKERFLELCEMEKKLIGDVLLFMDQDDTIALGKKMNENQKILVEIGVSNPTIDQIISIIFDYSFGVKITGAGGGGCIFSLSDKKNQKRIIEKMKQNAFDCFPVTIDYAGLDTF